MRIDPGIIEDNIRRCAERGIDQIFQRGQIGRIARLFRQADVEIRGRLVARPVLLAMQRGGEDARIIAEDQRRAIALMDIAINHRNALHAPLIQQQLSGDADIIEHAKAGPALRPGMMAAACQIHRGPLLQRMARGKDGARDRGRGTPRDGGRDLEPYLAGGFGIQRLRQDRRDIGLVMGQLQLVRAGIARQDEVMARLAQQLCHEGIFAHREAVVIGHGLRIIIGVVDNRQAHQARNLEGFPLISTYSKQA